MFTYLYSVANYMIDGRMSLALLYNHGMKRSAVQSCLAVTNGSMQIGCQFFIRILMVINYLYSKTI